MAPRPPDTAELALHGSTRFVAICRSGSAGRNTGGRLCGMGNSGRAIQLPNQSTENTTSHAKLSGDLAARPADVQPRQRLCSLYAALRASVDFFLVFEQESLGMDVGVKWIWMRFIM